MGRREKPEAALALDLARQGVHASEIARQTGYSVVGIFHLLKRHGVTAGKCVGHAAKRPKNVARAEKMAAMYRQGVYMEKIGEHFGVTRARVQQILKSIGVDNRDGGRRKQRTARIAASDAKRNLRTMAKWGISYAEMKARRQDGTLVAFASQRHSAQGRGIDWRLTFSEWLDVWEQSGKWALRGRGKGRYVMSRIKDEGGYVLGNVHIQLSTENNSQGIAKCRNNKAKHTGVWMLYPGLSTPWAAHFGKKHLGLFATEAEAVAARAAYIASKGINAPIRGRGYYEIRGKTRTTYQVMVGRKYVGVFSTPDEALAARAAALQQLQQAA